MPFSHLPSRHWVDYVLFPKYATLKQHSILPLSSPSTAKGWWGNHKGLGLELLRPDPKQTCHTLHRASLSPIEVHPHLCHLCHSHSPAWHPHERWTQILDSSLIILSHKGQFLNMFLMHFIPMSQPLSCPFAPKGGKYPCIKPNLILIFFLFFQLFHSIYCFACSIGL